MFHRRQIARLAALVALIGALVVVLGPAGHARGAVGEQRRLPSSARFSPPWNPKLGWTYTWAYTDCDVWCHEWGVDVPLPYMTPIVAPEAGVVWNYEAANGPCGDWAPGRLLLKLNRGGVIGFGHVTPVVKDGTHVAVGQEIATVGPTIACRGGMHVEFMYASNGCSNGPSCYVMSDFRCAPGCVAGKEYPIAGPLSQWTLLKSYMKGTFTYNGSFVDYEGNVYRIVGDAPIYVSSWAPFGGPQPVTMLTSAQFDALPQYPMNGTAVYDVDPGPAHGTGYIFVGGAPLAVKKWSNVNRPALTGIQGTTLSTYATSGPYSHVRQYPANGDAIFVDNPGAGHGSGYVFAGGAPTTVRRWTNVGGDVDPVGVDSAALITFSSSGAYSHVRQYPADGTFITSSSGGTYRVVGGYAFSITNCAVVDCTGAVRIDGWALSHTASPRQFTASPLNGTVVEGLPSATYWSFSDGKRTEVTAAAGEVSVDDSSLTPFPIG